MDPAAAERLLAAIPGWRLEGGDRLRRSYRFPDFATALAFVNAAGDVAEEQGHHPDLLLSWGRVEATLWTHAAGGLTESDFVLAARLDRIPREGA